MLRWLRPQPAGACRGGPVVISAAWRAVRCGSGRAGGTPLGPRPGAAPVAAGAEADEAVRLHQALGLLAEAASAASAASASVAPQLGAGSAPTAPKRRGQRGRRGSGAATVAAPLPAAAGPALPATPGGGAFALSSDWSAPEVVLDPTAGLVARQQEAWHQRLADDRVMLWFDQQRELKARLLEASQPKAEERADELPPAVVKDIFDSMMADPARELAERRDERLSETVAVQLESLLACQPPPALRQALAGALVRIVAVAAPGAQEAYGPHVVYYQCPVGLDPVRLLRHLNEAAPAISRAMARRLMLGLAPELTFVQHPGGSAAMDLPRRPSLWHREKLRRRETVHAAMGSWVANMNW